MAINLYDRDMRTIVLDDFSGGLNQHEAPTHLAPSELAEVTNMDIRQGRSISSRHGQVGYLDRAHLPLGYGAEGLFRYRSSTDLKKIILATDGKIYTDNDDGKFDWTFINYFSGRPLFHQFKNTLIIGTPLLGLYSHYPSASPANLGPDVSGTASASILTSFGLGGSTTNGYMDDTIYYWRITYSVYHNDVFLGETGAIRYLTMTGTGEIKYAFDYVHLDTTGASNYVEFKRPLDAIVDSIPASVKYLNFYRSSNRAAVPDQGYLFEEDTDLYLVGSVPMTTVRATLAGNVIFKDDASAPLGIQLRKLPMSFPPRPRRMEFHKERLWLGSPDVRQNDQTTYTYEPDRLYFSTFEANGPEPYTYFPESYVTIGTGEPDPITGLYSHRNKVLIAWKANSMWAILGADDEITVGNPNLSIELVSSDVGCVAPDSIQSCDGVPVWLSNRGVYAYDGTAPRRLSTWKIKKLLDQIPANRKISARSVYNSKEHEYCLFVTIPDGSANGATYNRHVFRYNFNTKAWTHDKLELGVGVAIEVRDDDSEGYMLWGLSDSPNTVFLNSWLVVKGDNGFLEGRNQQDNLHKVKFSFQTAFLDDGRPFESKDFQAILIESSAYIPLSVDVLIDNKYDSRSVGATLDVELNADDDTLIWDQGAWDEKNWANIQQGYSYSGITELGDTVPSGRSISLVVSGENVYDPADIHSITVFYKPCGVKEA